MQLSLRDYAINDCVLQEMNVLIITCSSSNYFFDFLHKYKKTLTFCVKLLRQCLDTINAYEITN